MITVPPAPHLLIRCTCSSLELTDSVFQIWTWTHSGPDRFCVMRVFPACFSLPACSLSTLPIPDLPVKPDSWITCLPFVFDHKLLYLPAHYQPYPFPSILLHSTPGKLTCFRPRQRDCLVLLTICKVNKVVLFLLIVSYLDPCHVSDTKPSIPQIAVMGWTLHLYFDLQVHLRCKGWINLLKWHINKQI